MWYAEDDGHAFFEEFAGHRIYRPRPASEVNLRNDAEHHLRSRYSFGVYRDRDAINDILQYQFAFFDAELGRILPEIASLDFLTFLLDEYDISHVVAELYKENKLAPQEMDRWGELGSSMRRAIKYLAECIVALSPGAAPAAADFRLLDLSDRCWSCCEQVVQLSGLSTQTFAVFPDRTKLTILPQGAIDYINLDIDDHARFQQFDEENRQETRLRRKYVNDLDLALNIDRGKRILDPPFQRAFGFNLSDAWYYAAQLNENSLPPPYGFQIPFVCKQQIVTSIVEDLQVTVEAANLLLDGITLNSESMRKEGRCVWKPKQEYRALSRPFFEVPHEIGSHLIWSKEMTKECLLILWSNLAFRRLPREWGGNEAVRRAVEQYGASLNRDFEGVVIDNLRSIGMSAGRFARVIGGSSSSLGIPPEVGELDCVAYSPREELLVIGEVKMVRATNEPATFRDDIDKFIGGTNNYLCQLRNKFSWVKENLSAVVDALARETNFPAIVSVQQISPVFITYYPTIASLFFDEFPCVSLTQLMENYHKNGAWSFPSHEVS